MKDILIRLAKLFIIALVSCSALITLPYYCRGPADKEPARKSNKECRRSLQCWGDRNLSSASVNCALEIENAARYDCEWTDGIADLKFSSFRWSDEQDGTLIYSGNKIKCQNAFGSWENCRYQCEYSPDDQEVVSVNLY